MRPAGVVSDTVSPSRAFSSAFATGDTQPIRPLNGSTSSTPTIVTVRSTPSDRRYITVVPKNTWSLPECGLGSTTSARSSRFVRKRIRRSISRRRFLPYRESSF
jgi:hypothetical protein